MDIAAQLDALGTREDLARFVAELRRSLLDGGNGWENTTLEQFLEALGAWCADLPGYFANRGEPVPEQPDWQLVGRMLLAAAQYE